MTDALIEIMQTVASSVLGIEAIAVEPTEPGRTTLTRSLVGCVQIAGAWSGAVLLRATTAFARLAAQTMFDAADSSDADQRDALGELANIVAGNLKPLLAAPSYLALPVVGSGLDLALAVCRSRPIERVELLVGEHRIAVTLLRQDPTPEDARCSI